MLSFKYSLKGGNLTSIVVDGEEKQYQPMEGSWTGQDVVIFPFVARLLNQTYTHNGKEYTLLNHGVARYNTFEVVEDTPERAILLLKSSEETKKIYPFDFELYVIYTAVENTLNVTYKIINKSAETMYFGVGGHPAIKVNYEDNDTKGNSLVFDEEIDLYYYTLDESFSFVGERKLLGKFKYLELDKSFFQKYGTLLIDSKKIDEVTLLRKDNKQITYNIRGRDFLAIWSHPTCGDYICVEPWDSLPDFIDADKELSKKKTIKSLEPNSEYIFTYEMTFID